MKDLRTGPDTSQKLRDELVEQIKAPDFKMPRNLPEIIKDAYEFQKLLITKIGVLPENSVIMASKEDREKIY